MPDETKTKHLNEAQREGARRRRLRRLLDFEGSSSGREAWMSCAAGPTRRSPRTTLD